MESRGRWTSMGALLLWSGAAGLAFAATQAVPKQPLVFKGDVAIVAVPVYVTDKSGKSVSGLTAADFEVEDGGKKVPIVGFQAIDVDSPATPESQAALPPALREAVAEPRRFVLLLDLEFSPKDGVMRARRQATTFVENALAPGDLVAVAISGPSGLRIVTNFSTDHAAAARAIGGLTTNSSTGSDPFGKANEPIASGAGAGKGGFDSDAELAAIDALRIAGDVRLYRTRVGGFLDDVEKLVKILSPLHGRKQLVLMSGGFAESSWYDGPSSSSDSIATVNGGLMQDIFKAAGTGDVVIHTVDLTGIEGPMDLGQQSANNGAVGSLKSPLAKSADAGQGSLIAMSHNTGGTYIRPTNDFGVALHEMDQVSRHSYVIAFEAADPNAKNNKPRSLKVRVKGAGLSVSHRPSYVMTASGASEAANGGTARPSSAAPKSSTRTVGPLEMHLVAVPYRGRDGKPAVHAAVQIDGAALAESATGAQMALQMRGELVREGRVVDTVTLNTSIDLTKLGDAIRTSGVRILTAFPAEAGPMELRFAAKTGANSVTGSIQQTLTAPDFTPDATLLSVPMFPVPLAGSVVVPFQPKDRPQFEIPFRMGNSPFVPDASVTLTAGQTRDICVFVWRGQKGAGSPLGVTAEMGRPGEAQHPVLLQGPPRVTSDVDGFDRYVMTLATPDLATGTYTLRLTFADSASHKGVATETAITLSK